MIKVLTNWNFKIIRCIGQSITLFIIAFWNFIMMDSFFQNIKFRMTKIPNYKKTNMIFYFIKVPNDFLAL